MMVQYIKNFLFAVQRPLTDARTLLFRSLPGMPVFQILRPEGIGAALSRPFFVDEALLFFQKNTVVIFSVGQNKPVIHFSGEM